MGLESCLKFVLAPLVLGLALTPQLLAQEEGPTLIRVNRLQIEPEMLTEFREVHRDVYMPAQKEGGVPWRVTSRTMLGDSFEISIATPLENFAALDEERESNIPEKVREMAGNIWSRSVQSRQAFVVQSRPDLSMDPQPRSRYARRARIVVAYGRQAEFEALWKNEILPALAKSGGKGYQVFQTVAGGSVSEYWGLMPLANMAALDGWGPFSGLSDEEAAALTARIAELTSTVEIAITRYDDELSFGME